MRDLGMIENSEPADRLFTQGMVIKDGAKMSKSRGNVVSPDLMIERYGADATRMYALFAAPPDRDLDWQEEGVAGISRFLANVYRLATKYARPTAVIPPPAVILSEAKDLRISPSPSSQPAIISSASSTRPSPKSPRTSAAAGTSTPPSPPS